MIALKNKQLKNTNSRRTMKIIEIKIHLLKANVGNDENKNTLFSLWMHLKYIYIINSNVFGN